MLGQRRRFADERGDDRVIPGSDRQPHAHVLVGGECLVRRLAGVVLVGDRRPIGVLAADGKQPDSLAVERQLHVVLFRDAPDRAARAAPEPHAELVVRVDRQVLVHDEAAARAERQVAEVVVLGEVFPGSCRSW